MALALGGALGAVCRAGVRVKNLKQMLKCLEGDESDDPSVKKGSKARCLSVLRALEVIILGMKKMLELISSYYYYYYFHVSPSSLRR